MKQNRLLKLYIFLFVVLFAGGLYLAFNLIFGLNSVEAATTEGKFWRDKPWALDGNCRREGNSCSSRAEFKDFGSANVPVGQMLYCKGNVGERDGLIYGNWIVQSMSECNYSQSALCTNAGRHGFISDGAGAQCGNPYKCPEATPTPTVPAQGGTVRVNTVCVDGNPNGATVDLTTNVVRASDGVGVARDNRRINIGDSATVNIFDRNQFPVRVNLDAQNITNGLRVSRNGCDGTNLNNGGSCTLEFSGCRPSTTTQTPTPSQTASPRCVNMRFADGSNNRSFTVGDTIDILMEVENVNADGGKIVPFVYNPIRAAKIPVTQSPAGYSPMTVDPANANAVAFNRIERTTNGNRSTLRFRVDSRQLYQTEQNTGQLMNNFFFHGYSAAWPIANDGACEVYLNLAQITTTPTITVTPSRPPQAVTPGVTIQKTLTSNAQPVQGQVTFNIDVRNTGQVDLRNFVVVDDFDPSYLQFVSATYRGQSLPPVQGTGTNGRTTLTWNDLPPGNDVLRVGDTFQIMLTFKSLRDSRPTTTLENDNCAVVSQITYNDANGQQIVTTINNQRSCAEFTTTTQLTVAVNKSSLTPSVSVGQEARFSASITNNTQDKTYNEIDFIDTYDSRYLNPVRVRVTGPNGAVRTYCPAQRTGCDAVFNTVNPIRINDIHTVDGALAPGKAYSFEIAFTAVAPVARTCDMVSTDVIDNGGNPTSGRSPEICVEIVAPPPPNTGANMVLNLFLPMAVLVLAAGGSYVLRYKYVA
jgi:uncharacterized repeat protein (TIGR01451 family)